MSHSKYYQRKRVLKLIRELQKHTIVNGCTEAEALHAVKKISELLEAYDLELSDIEEIREDLYGAFARTYGGGSVRRRSWHETCQTWSAVADFTDTKYWCRADQLIFFGSAVDSEIAFFLCDLFKNSSELEWKRFRRSRCGSTDRRGRASFMSGFCVRIKERLQELRDHRSKNVSKQGSTHSLVLQKNQVLLQKFSEFKRSTGICLRSISRSPTKVHDTLAYAAGAEAGSRTHITVGIGKIPGKYL